MPASATARRDAYVAKARAELASLASEGIVIVGNAFSPVLLAKGDVGTTELADGLLTGEDGTALRAALIALGYAPEEWCGAATVRLDGTRLDANAIRTLIATIDPATLVACDEAAADAIRAAYATELACLPSFEEAALVPGVVTPLLGMRVLNLGGFADALASMATKQRAWAWLKQIPPLSDPY